jgi:hypothetical protein
VERLFQNVLHRFSDNRIYFAKRGSRDRQVPLEEAIRRSVLRFEERWNTRVRTSVEVYAQTPVGEPCLSVADYMNWSVMRAYLRREMRYYRFVADKVSLLLDLYDTANYPNNWFSRKNPFDIDKTGPLLLGPVTGRTA